MESAITLRDVRVVKNGRPILDGVSAEIAKGQITGMLGPSGAGKTTLMRVIVGLQKPASGSAEVFGHAAGSAGLRKTISYMTQAVSVYPDLTLRENLRFFAAMTDAPAGRVAEVIETVDLKRQAKQLVGTLSGGEQSRVSLAIALLARPQLLVLDEPTVGLDPVLRKRLWQLFSELASGGTTLLVSSHVMDEAAHCDRLLLLREGTLLAHGTPNELKRRSGARSIEESFIQLVEAAA
jgi:ABC-2 type transport system ATP-binding protein